MYPVILRDMTVFDLSQNLIISKNHQLMQTNNLQEQNPIQIKKIIIFSPSLPLEMLTP